MHAQQGYKWILSKKEAYQFQSLTQTSALIRQSIIFEV